MLLKNCDKFEMKRPLRNMGHWLGMITLAKGEVVPMNLITLLRDMKLRGIHELENTISFVVKVLLSSTKSEVCYVDISFNTFFAHVESRTTVFCFCFNRHLARKVLGSRP